MEDQGKYIKAWIYIFNILSMVLILSPSQIAILWAISRTLNTNCLILSLDIDTKWVDIVFYT